MFGVHVWVGYLVLVLLVVLVVLVLFPKWDALVLLLAAPAA